MVLSLYVSVKKFYNAGIIYTFYFLDLGEFYQIHCGICWIHLDQFILHKALIQLYQFILHKAFIKLYQFILPKALLGRRVLSVVNGYMLAKAYSHALCTLQKKI